MQATKTILIADDSDGHRKVLELVLSAHNYEVVAAQDGHQALTYLQNNTPDLMILDINMPYASGIEVCQRAKRLTRLKHVPVIIMTSLTDTETRNAVQDAQADLLINKPITGKNLHEMIVKLWANPRFTQA
jgi:DNA-binding response OmpR family regulator